MLVYDFGNFLSTLREQQGLSQYQLCVLAGVSYKVASKYENGVSKPRINTMQNLAQILNISIDELMTCDNSAFNNRKENLFAMKKKYN